MNPARILTVCVAAVLVAGGAAHGDKTGADTALRTHWSNQATGIVNDEVFELKIEPANWGEITFP